MDHEHQLHDAGDVFEIDPSTRAITYKGTNELLLMQYDHNSEVYTFRLPKEIDGHDMTKCNKIEIHFINIGDTDKMEGLYESTDIDVDPKDTKYATFTWLVSQGATSFSGNLTFMIRFRCTEGDVVTYSWSTDVFSGIRIGAGFKNHEAFIDQYYDILESWRRGIVSTHEWNGTTLTITSGSGTSSADLQGPEGKSAYESAKDHGFEGTESEWLDFIGGFAKTVITIDGKFLHFFANTQAEYNKLSDAQKADLFAIITDDKTLEEIAEKIASLMAFKESMNHLYCRRIVAETNLYSGGDGELPYGTIRLVFDITDHRSTFDTNAFVEGLKSFVTVGEHNLSNPGVYYGYYKERSSGNIYPITKYVVNSNDGFDTHVTIGYNDKTATGIIGVNSQGTPNFTASIAKTIQIY